MSKPNPLNCIKINERVYYITTQAGFRKALRLLLAEGDLRYTNDLFSKPNYPTSYPCIIELKILRLDYQTDEIVVSCFSETEYVTKLSEHINSIQLTKLNLNNAVQQLKESRLC